MANNVSGNPYIIDTSTATAIIASGTRFKLYAVQWTSGSTANVCSVQDSSGTVKYEVVGSAANFTANMVFQDECPLIFNGLKVPTLDSGKVYLYVKPL